VDFTFGTFLFADQALIESDEVFAREGDSGSMVIDSGSWTAVGMVFASTGRFTAACALPAVIDALEKELGSRLRLHVSPELSYSSAVG